MELPTFSDKLISHYHFPKGVRLTLTELHGFSEPSEVVFTGVVHLHIMDSRNVTDVSLVMSKTKGAHLKWLTLPCLELCGAHLLVNLLHHAQKVFNIPPSKVFAWTHSLVMLS